PPHEQDFTYMGSWCLELGFLNQSRRLFDLAQSGATNKIYYEYYAIYYAVVGDIPTSGRFRDGYREKLQELYEDNPAKLERSNVSLGPIMLVVGDFEFVRKFGVGWVRGEGRLELGEVDAAIHELHQYLVEARSKSWHEDELRTRRVLAEAYRRKGDLAASRDV